MPAPVFWTILVLGAVAAGGYLAAVLADPETLMHLKDLGVYQIAGNRVLDGVSVYDTPLLGHTRGVWEFVYTPFAALLFVPLAKLNVPLIVYVGGIGNFLILAVAAWAALALLGYRRDLRLAVFSLPVAALLLWCEPIRQTMAFGQVNILLMTLVLVDLALPDSFRGKGALIGIAAGIKLTPAFFVLYLLFSKRYRAALTSVISLAVTLLIGFLVLPHDSKTFWSGAFADPARVGVPQDPSNESLRGMFARTIGVTGGQQLLWLVVAGAIALACLLLARRLSSGGHELLAVTLCGLTTTAVSPYSWVHHWVWLAALLICLLDASLRRWAVSAWVGLALTFAVASGGVLLLLGSDESSILTIPWDHQEVNRNAYLWLTIVALAVVALRLKKPAQDREAAR
ncbi:glycosyltransferase 87 family protein [Amycolatopsis cynarae]|uniref:Glycosyltransferase 87 family protein n=1 Tax=Amycolatopsis cynarae TaxID=2995223 RepID=A0ABY7B8C6_9PSEU|nr:glycosyltransferase 87 family protein [Amycolatopsis sp. HUAS 11-8]WAL67659.1 glycosyltransferase 87 family protein [Amycolatopsis sp. HUAS 11-8]